MFEAIDKMIEESAKSVKEDKDVASIITLFDSLTEGEIPPQFLKNIKKKGGDDEDKADDKADDKKEDKADDKKEDVPVDESAIALIKRFNKLTEGDQERLDKSDDAEKGNDDRSGEEQGKDKSGGGKGGDGEVKSDGGVKKGTEGALVDWVTKVVGEAAMTQLTQDHQVHKQGNRGAIGDVNDGDKNKDDALPDSTDAEAKPENATKLIDKSGGVKSEGLSAMEDWQLCAVIEK